MATKNMILTVPVLATTTLLNAQDNKLTKPINGEAPVKCSKSILINADPAKVWSVLTNINDWDKWQSEISQPRLNGPLKPNSTFTWKTGGAKIHSTLHTVEPNKAFGWTGKTFGMFAIHNWNLVVENGGTRVTVNESMEGFLTGLFKKSFNKNLEKGMIKWLEMLKVESEE